MQDIGNKTHKRDEILPSYIPRFYINHEISGSLLTNL